MAYTTSGQGESDLYFNMCEPLGGTYACSTDTDSFASEVRVDGSCYSLTNTAFETTTHEYYDTNNHTLGLTLGYLDGDICPYSSNDEVFRLSVNVVCDETRTGEPQVQLLSNSLFDPCNPIIQLNHQLGCATRVTNTVWDILYDLRILMGPVMFIIGVIYTFLGLRQYKPVLAITGCLTTVVIPTAVAYVLFMSENDSVLVFIILLGLLILTGIFVTGKL